MNRGIFKDTWLKEAKKHVATNRIQIMTTSFQGQCSNNKSSRVGWAQISTLWTLKLNHQKSTRKTQPSYTRHKFCLERKIHTQPTRCTNLTQHKHMMNHWFKEEKDKIEVSNIHIIYLASYVLSIPSRCVKFLLGLLQISHRQLNQVINSFKKFFSQLGQKDSTPLQITKFLMVNLTYQCSGVENWGLNWKWKCSG